MSERAGPTKNELVDLFGGRPGWRLEPRSTPGATPLWCFVVGGKIEFSVTRDRDGIHLYVMETDQEIDVQGRGGTYGVVEIQSGRGDARTNGQRRPGEVTISEALRVELRLVLPVCEQEGR